MGMHDVTFRNDFVQMGNAMEHAKGTGQSRDLWYVGPFMKGGDLRHTEQVEMKFGCHKAGEGKKEWAKDSKRTIVTLFKGKLRMEFRESEDAKVIEFILEKPGDCIVSLPGYDHRWEVLEDCLTQTVRGLV